MLRVGHGIHSLLLAVFQRVSLVLAEVDAADELTHDDEVDALGHDLGLEGAGRGQLGPDLGRAVVGVQAHAGAQAQQALFRALLPGQALPFGAAHGTQQHAVGGQALVQLVLGQGVAVFVDGLAAHCGVGVVEGVAVLFGHLIENAEGLLHDLGAGAVAPDDSNVFFHSYGHPFFDWAAIYDRVLAFGWACAGLEFSLSGIARWWRGAVFSLAVKWLALRAGQRQSWFFL